MNGAPFLYWPPSEFATLLDNVASLVDREPDENFRDNAELRIAANHLARILDIRLRETDSNDATAENE